MFVLNDVMNDDMKYFKFQNVIISSLAYCQLSLKISCKSVHKLLRKVANTQTDRQTD